MFTLLNEREERKQGGNLEELKYFSSMISAFFPFPQIKTANFIWLGRSFQFGGEFRNLAKILTFPCGGTTEMR